MKAGFSEFSYGFALSYEIMNALQPAIVGAPLFPALLQEGKSGYDVSFVPTGWPLFLQFKLAEYLKTRRSKYWRDHHMPYFRLAIHKRRHSRQHNLLRELSRIESEVC
jgi:hypothetical protein